MDYKTFAVTLGNGTQVKGQGICPSVKLQLGGLEVIQNFFPFALGNIDVTLGVE